VLVGLSVRHLEGYLLNWKHNQIIQKTKTKKKPITKIENKHYHYLEAIDQVANDDGAASRDAMRAMDIYTTSEKQAGK
jgi:hypothetical protein